MAHSAERMKTMAQGARRRVKETEFRSQENEAEGRRQRAEKGRKDFGFLVSNLDINLSRFWLG